MDAFSTSELHELMAATDGPCGSMFMPTERISVKETGEDVLRFKNLLKEAEAKLSAYTEDSDKAASIMRQAHTLLDDEAFWKNQDKGLAVYLSQQGFRTFRLPLTFAECVSVGERFDITPLLPLLTDQPSFYILAVAKGTVRVLKGDKDRAATIDIPGLPYNMDDALWYRESERLLQMRNSAGEAGSYHGEGEDSREPNVEMREYLLKVDDALTKTLKSGPTPLVVVGLSPMAGLFRQLTKYQNLAGVIEHDANHVNDQELHDLAWPLIEPLAAEPIRIAKNLYASLAANQPARTESDPDRIAEAAEAGRVDTLLIAQPIVHDEVVAFGETVQSVHGAAAPLPNATLERAAQATLSNSGSVRLIPADEMPSHTPMAAVLRY